jgi:hypothetical protein
VSKPEEAPQSNIVGFGISLIEQMYFVKRSFKEENETKYADEKEFPLTADGFSKATDYFEELIAQQTKKEGENPDGSNNAPPIGFLEIMTNSIVSVEMQDGRKAQFTKKAYTIKSNIFTILVDFNGFEKNERYYVDVIGSNPKIMGLYPIGDLESGDPSTSQKIDQEDVDDISDGKDPFDQNDDDGDPKDGDPKDGEPKDGEPKDGEPKDGEPKDGEPKDGEPKDGDPKDGEPKDGKDGEQTDTPIDDEEGKGRDKPLPTSKDILAKSYGISDFNSLVKLFGSKENLLEDILLMDDMEKSGLMTKLATNYRDNSQFEKFMRTIILN